MRKIKWIALGILLNLLLYTRFVNLSWGLPHPFHPDERNLAVAVQGLNCNYEFWKECFNPHFFAYGQFPIYLAYILVALGKFVSHLTGPIRFDEVVIALRFISASASIATVFVSLKILKTFIQNTEYKILSALLFIFSPVLIQFAHFGTTESLLMFFYTTLVYISITSINYLNPDSIGGNIRSVSLMGAVTGVTIGTKASSAIFAVVPLVSLLRNKKIDSKNFLILFCLFSFFVLFFFILSSPHNLISFSDFVGTLHYESDVALGKTSVFYTRMFEGTIPVLFQLQKVFPYALGWPVFIAFLLGFFLLPNKKEFNLLRFAFLIYFIPAAFLYAKWTRFMAPVFPLMIIFVSLFLYKIKEQIEKIKDTDKRSKRYFLFLLCNFALYSLIFALVYPGIRFLRVYTTSDVRFQASEWMAKNIPKDSIILQETANVVDLPVFPQQYSHKAIEPSFMNISFDFYHLDENPLLQAILQEHLKRVDYVIIPSRRIFKNHSRNKYPILNKYYDDLFSGKLGFKKVAEFKVLNDEDAEETWTVFDHPIVRIYKRV